MKPRDYEYFHFILADSLIMVILCSRNM